MNETEPLRRCRFCTAPLRHVFVDLGRTALANRNLKPEEIGTEQTYPLIARVCDACFLVQVDDSVPPEAIFSDYDYFSSVSESWVAHAKAYATEMIARLALGPNALVVEIASNDGYLLQHFVAGGVPVLGIEPAANVAEAARARHVPTEVAFFSTETARMLASRGVGADLMVANNVLAHVPAIGDFVSGFSLLLKPQGVATFEFPHVLKMIESAQFDTIYHEHFYYHSLLTTSKIFAASGLRVFDVEELSTHGGSLRLFVCQQTAAFATGPRVDLILESERAAGLDGLAGYYGFAARVEAIRLGFKAFLDEAKAYGRKVAAYGAAAKGNTFLNVCGATAEDIVEVYDRNTAKQGKRLPGTHIPIVDPESMRLTRPDYLVVLPWNLLDEIRETMRHLQDWGGRFVIATPTVQVLDA